MNSIIAEQTECFQEVQNYGQQCFIYFAESLFELQTGRKTKLRLASASSSSSSCVFFSPSPPQGRSHDVHLLWDSGGPAGVFRARARLLQRERRLQEELQMRVWQTAGLLRLHGRWEPLRIEVFHHSVLSALQCCVSAVYVRVCLKEGRGEKKNIWKAQSCNHVTTGNSGWAVKGVFLKGAPLVPPICAVKRSWGWAAPNKLSGLSGSRQADPAGRGRVKTSCVGSDNGGTFV